MSHQQEMKPTALPRAGDILLGRYVVEGIITRGGFAVIYRGRQLGVDRTVAIKCLDPESIRLDPAAPQRFSREAKLASGLQHPNTITIFDYGRTKQGILFLVMEHVEGVSLNRVLRYGRIDPERAVYLIKQVLQSLREAHDKEIIHRDLKPANIMVCDRAGEQDVVKVLDFGIAKAIGEGPGSRNLTQELTGSDRVIGTPRYMAPEQLAGETVTPATDLYSVGLMLYEMLVGRPAIDKGSSLENMTAQLSDDPIPLPADVPAAYREVLRDAIQKMPNERFQSSKEFIEALDAARPSAHAVIPREIAEAKTLSVDRELVEELALEARTRAMSQGMMPDPSGAYAALNYGRGLAGRPRLLMLFNMMLAVLLVAVGVTLGVVLVTQFTDSGSTNVVATAPTEVPAPAEPASPVASAPLGYAVPGGSVMGSEAPSYSVPGGGVLQQTPAQPPAPAEQAAAMPRMDLEAARMHVGQAVLAAANTAEPLVFVFAGEPTDAEIYLGPDRLGIAGEPLTIARQRLPAEIEIAHADFTSQFQWVNETSRGTVAFRLTATDDGNGRRRARSERPVNAVLSSTASSEPEQRTASSRDDDDDDDGGRSSARASDDDQPRQRRRSRTRRTDDDDDDEAEVEVEAEEPRIAPL